MYFPDGYWCKSVAVKFELSQLVKTRKSHILIVSSGEARVETAFGIRIFRLNKQD
jgi:hypothetical protein